MIATYYFQLESCKGQIIPDPICKFLLKSTRYPIRTREKKFLDQQPNPYLMYSNSLPTRTRIYNYSEGNYVLQPRGSALAIGRRFEPSSVCRPYRSELSVASANLRFPCVNSVYKDNYGGHSRPLRALVLIIDCDQHHKLIQLPCFIAF